MVTGLVSSQTQLDDWRSRIEIAWQKSVASVIEVGKLIKEAKQELGVSYNLLETELPFSSTVAAFLVKIAEHPVLSNPAYFQRLPNSYNTLYHLTSVEEAKLVEQIENGEISPNYSLSSAKLLRNISPTLQSKSTSENKLSKNIQFEVGSISIGAIRNLNEFETDLSALLEKYDGKLTITKKENSLAEWHREHLHKQAIERIEKSESELQKISLEDIRMLEDAAHFLSKDRNQKNKAEVVLNGELVIRTSLPTDYKDYKKITELIGQKEITRGYLKKWCIENKVPNQFTELSSMDKELYVWEQVRLITEKRDVKGGLKRLKDLSSRSTIPKIKSLAKKVLDEVTRFDKK